MMLEGCTPWPAETTRRYRSEGFWTGQNLAAMLAETTERNAERTALIHGDRRITYRELGERVERMAAGFQRAGIGAGDRVVVQLPNVPEFVTVVFALIRAGAKPVFTLAAHRAVEISYICRLTEASGYVVPAAHRGFDHLGLARAVRKETPTLRHIFVLDDAPVPDADDSDVIPLSSVDAPPAANAAGDSEDVAFFLLSGGTTALPKLIPRNHDGYLYQARMAAEASGVTAEDVYLAALPVEFNFTWGCPGVVGVLQAGGTVVLASDPEASRCFAAIERERVTFTSLVPTVAQLWLEATEWTDADLSSLRFVQVGGARLHPDLARRIPAGLGCRLQQVFGMAEGLITVTRPGDRADVTELTQGRPLSPGDELRIVDEQGREVAAGAVGELLTRGPYTLRGYYRAPEHNGRAFTADGFYRTGDLARLTGDGDLVIEGRVKDVIIRGGDKISPEEVEGRLVAHPAIAAAAVVAVPDPLLGERSCAYLVCPADRPAASEVKAWLSEQGLAGYKLPDRVEFIAELPLTALGKADKRTLTAWATGREPDRASGSAPEPRLHAAEQRG